MNFRNKKVLITGGSIGIGLEMASQLEKQGAHILICGRTVAALKEAKKEIPSIAIFPCDIKRLDHVKLLLKECQEVLGGVDVLINNAAIFRRFNFLDDYPIESQIKEIETNLNGLLIVTNVFLKEVLKSKSPCIVNFTSPAAIVPLASAPVYSAVKAGVSSLTTSLRFQLRDTKTRVILLCPPAVDTRMNANNPGVEARKLMTKKKFVRIALRGIKRNKQEILVSPINLFNLINRFAPKMAFKMINKKSS